MVSATIPSVGFSSAVPVPAESPNDPSNIITDIQIVAIENPFFRPSFFNKSIIPAANPNTLKNGRNDAIKPAIDNLEFFPSSPTDIFSTNSLTLSITPFCEFMLVLSLFMFLFGFCFLFKLFRGASFLTERFTISLLSSGDAVFHSGTVTCKG